MTMDALAFFTGHCNLPIAFSGKEIIGGYQELTELSEQGHL